MSQFTCIHIDCNHLFCLLFLFWYYKLFIIVPNSKMCRYKYGITTPHSFTSTHLHLNSTPKDKNYLCHFFSLKSSLDSYFGNDLHFSLTTLLSPLFFEYHGTVSAEKALHGSSPCRRGPWRCWNQAGAVYLLSLSAESRNLTAHCMMNPTISTLLHYIFLTDR